MKWDLLSSNGNFTEISPNLISVIVICSCIFSKPRLNFKSKLQFPRIESAIPGKFNFLQIYRVCLFFTTELLLSTLRKKDLCFQNRQKKLIHRSVTHIQNTERTTREIQFSRCGDTPALRHEMSLRIGL